MNPAIQQIGLERIYLLISSATSLAKSNPDLSQRHAFIAKRISMRNKIRLPYEIQIVFCKQCKSFIAPGINSKIRIGRASVRAIRITCNFCGHTYRKIIPKT